MRAAQYAKATNGGGVPSRANMLGLKIKTDVASNNCAPGDEGELVFTQIASAPPRKLQFELSSDKSATKVSEALKNSDWRNNRRKAFVPPLSGGASLIAPATAGPENTSFQRTGGKPTKKLSIDISLANQNTVRRYRETPVDPDFIHTAPITKRDYKTVEDGTVYNNGEESYNSSDTTEPYTPPWMAGTPVVQLGSLTPVSREGFGKVRDLRTRLLETQTWENNSAHNGGYNDTLLRAIPIHSNTQRIQDLTFPVAAVQAIKDSKRFSGAGWDGIHDDIRKSVAQLEVPRTAGLPAEQLREEYQKRERALAPKSVQENGVGQRHKSRYSTEIDQNETAEYEERFNALINKLQKSSANRVYPPPVTDEKPPCQVKRTDENIPLSRPFQHDSEVHAAAFQNSARRGSILNPMASEFQSGSNPHICNQYKLPSKPLYQKENFYQEPYGYNFSPSTDIPRGGTQSEDTQLLRALVTDLSAQVAQIKAESRQSSNAMETALSRHLEQIEGLVERINLSGAPHGQGGSQNLQSASSLGSGLSGWPAPRPHSMCASAVYPPSQPAGILPTQHYTNQPTQFTASDALPSAPAPQFPIAPQQAGQSITQPVAHQPPPYGPSSQLPGPPGSTGSGNPSQLPLYAQARMAYGPKPVRKPKGPYINTSQQQAYEEYLEQRRATDPNYALQCRERQAKRAQRQRNQPAANMAANGAPSQRPAAPHATMPQEF